MSQKKIIIFSPHPDDEIIWCGWTIAKAKRMWHEISIVYLSFWEYSSPNIESKKLKLVRKKEALKVIDFFWISKKNVFFLWIEDNAISANDLDSMKKIIEIIRNFKPDIAYIPNRKDNYFDHSQSWILVLRALDMAWSNNFFEYGGKWFRVNNILEYEIYTTFNKYSYTEDISDYIDYKIKAIKIYNSQSKLSWNISNFISDKVAYLSWFRAAYTIWEFREVFNVIRTTGIL